MNKIDLNKNFVDLDGSVLNNMPVMAKRLANRLYVSQNQAEAAKFADIALKTFGSGNLEVDNTDLNKVKQFIAMDQGKFGLMSYEKAQITKEIESQQKESKKK